MGRLTIRLIGRNDKKDRLLKDALKDWAMIQAYMNSDVGRVMDSLEQERPDVILLSIDVDDLMLDKVIEQFGKRTILVANDDIYETKRIVRAIQSGLAHYINIHPHEELDLHLLQTKIKQVNRDEKIRIGKSNRPVANRKDFMLMDPVMESSVSCSAQPSIQTVVAIGASTGGPRALEVVIRNLPGKIDLPILIVQHMPEKFTKSLADRLNRIHPEIIVKEAEHLEALQDGTIYIAPGNFHMEIRKRDHHLLVHLHQEQEKGPHRPSIDVLFQSLSFIKSVNKIAVILTGMGKDGAQGIRQMKRNDPHTIVIVESKETVVVNGMTSAAIATNCVNEIVPIKEVSKTILKYIM